MSDFKRCRRYICGPLNDGRPAAEWEHQEGCSLYGGVLPALDPDRESGVKKGERLVFGVHRQSGADADTAPAWGGADWVSQVYRAKKGSSDAEV